MRLRVVRIVFAAWLACASGALAAPPMDEASARREVRTVAYQRLSHAANRNASNAVIRLDRADKTSFFFDAHASRPCLPSQDVCSSLIGHFRVDRRSGVVFDEDVEPERRVTQ